MYIAGIDLDITPATLQEWHNLNPNLQESLEALFTEPRDFNYVIPTGFKKDPETNGKLGLPIKSDLHLQLKVLDRVRFLESMSITESLTTLKSIGIRTTQTAQNTLDRLEGFLGILPELPATVLDKAETTKQKLEWQRKRRVLTRDKKKRKRLLEAKKKIEHELKKEARDRINDAKQAKLTLEELQGESDQKIQRLKAEATNSRFLQDELLEDLKDRDILFRPTPKQAEFLAAPEKLVLYGGAAGGIIKQNKLYSAPLCP